MYLRSLRVLSISDRYIRMFSVKWKYSNVYVQFRCVHIYVRIGHRQDLVVYDRHIVISISIFTSGSLEMHEGML